MLPSREIFAIPTDNVASAYGELEKKKEDVNDGWPLGRDGEHVQGRIPEC